MPGAISFRTRALSEVCPNLNGQTINLAPANGTIVLNKNLEFNTAGLPAGLTVNGNALAPAPNAQRSP